MMLPSSISKDPFDGTFLFPVMYYIRELLQKKRGDAWDFYGIQHGRSES